MEQDFFTYLPPEITMNILLRLPVRTAMSCKCVHKSWRSLIETPQFVESYKSVTSLAVFEGETSSIPYKVYELEDELNLEKFKNPCNVAFNFSLPEPKFILSSANGLLLLADPIFDLAICNPVTRECINLPAPPLDRRKWRIWLGNFGFGVSKETGLYKLVGIFHIVYDPEIDTPVGPVRLSTNICVMYTLLERGSRDQLVIWSMNSYGDGNSWTKQFVIAKTRPCRAMDRYMRVLKVFKDGEFMMRSVDRDYGIICCSTRPILSKRLI